MNIRLIHWIEQVHGVSFKKRAPRAIKEIRGFAEKAMVCGHFRRSQSMERILVAVAT